MLLVYQLDWIKIVDFLLIAKFWACVLFFVHPLHQCNILKTIDFLAELEFEVDSLVDSHRL